MKKIIILLFFSIFSTNALATEIAIVDVQGIEVKSKKVEIFRNEIDKKQKEYNQKAKEMEADVQKNADKLREKSSILSSDQLKKEESELKKKIQIYSEKTQKFSMIIEAVKMYGVSDLNRCLWDEVEQYAKSNSIDMAIPSSSVMYFSKNIKDITKDVLKSLDKSSCEIDAKLYFKKAESEVEKIIAKKND